MQESFWQRQLPPRRIVFRLLFWGSHLVFFAFGWSSLARVPPAHYRWKQAHDPRLADLNSLGVSVWVSRGAGLALAYDSGLILLPVAAHSLFPHLTLDAQKYPLLPAPPPAIPRHRRKHLVPQTDRLRHALLHRRPCNSTLHQLLPRPSLPDPPAQRSANPLYPACWNNWPLYAPHDALDLYYCPFIHPKTLLRGFLVHSPPWVPHSSISSDPSLFFFLALYSHATGCFVRDTPGPFSPFDTHNFFKHCLGYEAWRFTIWVGILYISERVYREIRASRPTRITKVLLHPQAVIEIQFTKPSLTYISGQWIFLNCPAVSRFQWHPFTITSCPSDPYLSIHVRQVGDFTKQLGSLLGVNDKLAYYAGEQSIQGAMQNGQRLPDIRIDGPFGAPAEDVSNYDISVIIGAGIGVTPWASILRNIYDHHKTRSKDLRLQRLEFIWICKHVSSFEWFQTLLLHLEKKFGNEFLRIHIFLTGQLDPDTVQNIVINNVGNAVDPLTQLASRTHFGRPDFSAIFKRISEGVSNGSYLAGLERNLCTKVGVFYCGPGLLAKTLGAECAKASSEEILFRLWKEHF
ncbi:Superoxide-generating NADPH oxidase heavy chain subunit A [Neolecta irregularis DAH-3]|uniref:Superoxide-generating NADPH oxidase heavy chain subunit A n=1 Tax=Neolecta irregularis (strain DAH-3) TaxID=1198029 RepID=A0A1U7LQH4_NEOID|nr:Superoxide-generating NADPH oxidase heavy chain subunit A [Neolecta irregularis DAH-3]|eukprot:OLL24771.1 Superoxide-generating NADPH oxidase heavy chain subunit A [Neolecta irregularis DAH-3]